MKNLEKTTPGGFLSLSEDAKSLAINTSNLTNRQKELALSFVNTTTRSFSLSGAFTGIGSALKGLGVAITTNPLLLLATVIAGVTLAASNYAKKIKEIREETISQAKQAQEESGKLSELKAAYDEAAAAYQSGTGTKDELSEATYNLLQALGLEESELRKLKASYGDLAESMDDVIRLSTIDSLNSKRTDLAKGYQAAVEQLFTSHDYKGVSVDFKLDDDSRRLVERLQSRGLLTGLYTWGKNASFDLSGDGESFEGIVAMEEKANRIRKVLQEIATNLGWDTERLINTSLWKNLEDISNAGLSDVIDTVENAKDAIDDNIASLAYLSENGKIPETAEEFYQLRDSLIAVTEADNDFIGTHEDAIRAVDKELSNHSFSAIFASDFNEFEHNLKNASGGWYDLLVSKAKDASVDIKAYVQDIFNDSEMFGDQGLDDWARKYNYTIDDIVTHLKSLREEIDQPIVETEKSNAALDAFRRKLKTLRADVVRSIGLGLELSKDQTEEYYRWLDAMGYLDGETAEVQAKAAQLKAEFRQFFASDPPWNITDQAIASRLEQAVVNFQNIRDGIKTGKFGNVDVFDREANFRIEWDEENLDRFKNELEAMGQNVEELKGQYSTMFASWDTFEGIDIAFTPILNVDNGDGSKEAVLLSPETVNKYIAEVLKEARSRGNGELTADLILQVDSEGIEGIDNVGRKLNGLIAAVGDTAEITSMLMHDVAVDADNTAAALLMAGEYLEYAMDSAMGYIENVLGVQLADLASLRDELQLTGKAWEEYQEITSAGDPSDWANKYADAYEKAMTDIDNGRIDTPAVWGAAKLLFSDEQLAAMKWDLTTIAHELRNEFFSELLTDPDGMEDADKLDIGAKFLNRLNKIKNTLESAEFDVDASGMFHFTYDSPEAFAKELGISEEFLATLIGSMDAFGEESMRSRQEQDKLVDSFKRMFDIVNAASDAIDGDLKEALSDAFDGLSDEEIQQKVENIKSSINELGNLQTVLNEFAASMRLGGMQENHIMDVFNSMKDEISEITGTELSVDDSRFNDAIVYANKKLKEIDKEKSTPSVDLDTSEGETKATKFREFCNTTFEGMNYPATITPVMDENAYNNIRNRLASLQTVTPQGLASGTLNAPGGVTLVNELGPELISDNGVAYIANGGKPGFTNLNKGAIVFNAEETKDIFSHTHPNIQYQAYADGSSNEGIRRHMITGMMVPGRAFSSQTGYFPTASIAKKYPNTRRPASTTSSGYTPSSNYGNNYNSYDGYTADDNVDEPVYEKVDWISVLLGRIQKAVDAIEHISSSGFMELSTKLQAARTEVYGINKEISAQKHGYTRYMREAQEVGLSEDIAKLVRNGLIDIDEYDEDTRKLIDEYQEWYDKAMECKYAVEELHQEIADLYQDMFNYTQADFENQLSIIEHSVNMINTNLSAATAESYIDTTEYYKQLTELEYQRIAKMNEELEALTKRFDDAMASGEIEEYSEAWYAMQKSILSVKESIEDANVQLLQYKKTMRDIEWGYFDYAMERYNQLGEEANFLIGIMSNDKLFNEIGRFDSKGTATMGLRVMNYNAAIVQAEEYAKEMRKIEEELAENPYDKDLIARRQTLLGLQRKSIEAAESEKDSMKDLISQGIQAEISYLDELIDTYEKSLDSAKSLYDYQKKISEKTGDVAKIQKQLVAYQGDTSEENRARVQQLQEQLRKAQDDLAETEWEQSIAEQKKLLSDFQDQYEGYMNERLDDLETLVLEIIEDTNDNFDVIAEELQASAKQVGYTISDEMSAILENGVYAYYDEVFDGITSISGYLDSINHYVSVMAKAAAEEAKDAANKIDTTPSSRPSEGSVAAYDALDFAEKQIDDADVLGAYSRIGSSSNKAGADGQSSAAASAEFRKYVGYLDTYIDQYNKNPTNLTRNLLKLELLKVFKAANQAGINTNDPIQQMYAQYGNSYVPTDLSEAIVRRIEQGLYKTNPFKGFSTGGLADYTGLAMLHGTKTKPEIVLNAKDTENFLKAAELFRTPMLTQLASRELKLPTFIGGASAGETTINLGGINIEHVQDYNDFITQLRSDPKFERLIGAMTFDRMDGKSSFGSKNKIRFN